MSDEIFIKDLVIRAAHGVHAAERRAQQEFSVDISIRFDALVAGASDKVEDTFDYGRLRNIAYKVFAGTSCNLLERLASEIASEILADPRIIETSISIRKPYIYPDCVAGISITRQRPFTI